jgi:hypothetical protein
VNHRDISEPVRQLQAARDDPETYKTILRSWLSILDAAPPDGVLIPPRGTPGRPRKQQTDAIVATWKALHPRPFLSTQHLARAVYGDAFVMADSREKNRLVNLCRLAVERRIPRDEIPRPLRLTKSFAQNGNVF